MKKIVFANAAFLAVFVFFPFYKNETPTPDFDITAYKIKNAVYCTPDRATISLMLDKEDIPPMPGSGSYVWKISTKSDSAQFYFNQGINMYYGFHIIESLASFKKAARFDAENHMIWWAQALALGPNINDMGYDASPEAVAATKKALELSANASATEKALINAMKVRYSEDTSKNQEQLNQAYTDAMKAAYELHPSTPDIMVLYADAMMLLHPWDLWNVNGTPKPWTPAIQTVLEKALLKSPMHPGANHYYIHIVEPSPYPEKALPSADRLGKITPGLAHLVHMPSHIYLRTGKFNTGTDINRLAVDNFEKYSQLFPASAGGAFIYQFHNLHMLANCAMHAGRYTEAIAAAIKLNSVLDSATLATEPPVGSLLQNMYMTPVLINTRFEKWDSLLAMPKPADQFVYANLLYHFGKGMAENGKNNSASAQEHAIRLTELMKTDHLKLPMTPFSSAFEAAMCAEGILKGSIAVKEQNYKDAIKHFTAAAEADEKMVYNEPRDWFLNPNQYLGTAYLAAKNYTKAEQAFKKDLTKNAKNPWSLNGLYKALQAQNKKKAALKVKADLKEASAKGDTDIAKTFFLKL